MRYLLVNPPVYDFAAYDYWLKPLGLLYISSILKKQGHQVDFIDCMDRFHPETFPGPAGEYGKGEFEAKAVNPPDSLRDYKRKYSIYGIHGEKLNNILKEFKEPLLHNNSIFPSFDISKWKDIFKLKRYVTGLNEEYSK
ncbi:MAG: hypothetical protein PF545_05855 [Elusimicrobia bacterium]|jgi:hypothetical protein|nr:hypothetical protein [Elusimicrobiota bacterium]